MNDIDYNAPPVVKMVQITKRFPGVVANDKVDLELYKGEVLALLGENGAGKSTLMNMLIGLYKQDNGEVYINDKKAIITSPQDSMALGVGMIHQEFMLVDNLTVAENVILGIKNLDIVPKMGDIKKRIKDISEKYNLEVNPNTIIHDLTVGEQQRVEILKLVYRGAQILILDEPTAVLTPGEARQLNKIVHLMMDEGKSAIFISHKMDEVMYFSNRVQILRRGISQGVKFTKDIKDTAELANMMVGKPVLFEVEKGPFNPKNIKVKLEHAVVHGINGSRNTLDDVSLEIKGGEILGIAGVAGNGQQVLSEVITGLTKMASGKLIINGDNCTNKTPLTIIKEGVSHIPADRGKMGVVGDMSVQDNLAMKKYRTNELSNGVLIQKGLFGKFANRLIQIYCIKTPTKNTEVKFLSGGNIQKTILAREIDNCKGMLVAVFPTRGLDVGATQDVRKSILAQRDKGCAILLVSEELDELLMLSDRISVMHEGKIMGTVDAKNADIEKIGLMMTGVKE